MKSYAAVCLEGAVIVLACVIFSVFAATPPTVDTSASAVTMVWSYIGELIFNMLVLTGTVKMAEAEVSTAGGVAANTEKITQANTITAPSKQTAA